MSDQLNQIYRVADGGPFTLAIENGDRDIIIENVTDDLVNAGILVRDTTLQDIAEAWHNMTSEDQAAVREACDGYEDEDALDIKLDGLGEPT